MLSPWYEQDVSQLKRIQSILDWNVVGISLLGKNIVELNFQMEQKVFCLFWRRLGCLVSLSDHPDPIRQWYNNPDKRFAGWLQFAWTLNSGDASLSWIEVRKSTSLQWDIRFSFCCFRCHKLTYLSPQCSPHRQRQLCQRCFIVGQISAAAGMHMISKADPLADLGQSLNISWTRISVNHFDFPQKHRNSEEKDWMRKLKLKFSMLPEERRAPDQKELPSNIPDQWPPTYLPTYVPPLQNTLKDLS